jgi:ribonuclease HI
VSFRRLRVVVEADGGARGNPGPAGYGAVVREVNTGEVLAERSEFLGVATNNVAEYSGLIAGLQAAAELGAVEVEIRMDSKLVVEQMSGRWQIKNPGLRPLAAKAAALVRRFESVKFSVRVRRVAAKLLDSYPQSVVVVVSHVSPLKLMLRDALAASDAFLYRLYLDPTGISIVDSWPDGGVAVRTVNDTAHLAGIT